ncbi:MULTISPECIES: flavin reductase family protein [Streptacidiphilus]|uniref:Flavin reductase family protein n=2 Tax=Streptacidiphilus TaxID=228398 RepID=A0ABV6UYG4_9ACTN|nr:flavin reductase family protein [Streptacidiphilus jeojiense]
MASAHEFTTDPEHMRAAFSGFPSGVVAIATLVGAEPVIMIASSFTVGVSYRPPMVSFAVQRGSTTWPLLSGAPVLGISLLSEVHAGKTRQLASRNKQDRLRGIGTTGTASGAVFLDDAPSWLECAVEHRYPAGDHEIVVLRVLAMSNDHSSHPLVWHRKQPKVLQPIPGSAPNGTVAQGC